jgi:hypothetical protein
MKRLLAVLVGLIVLLTSCSVAPRTEVERPWERTIEADGISFVIPLKGGDRVQIQVSNASGISTLKDPFGNVLMQSATKVEYYQETNEMVELGRLLSGHSSTPIISPHTVGTQKYPWRFAFVAASSGDYTLTTSGINDKPAHLAVFFDLP